MAANEVINGKSHSPSSPAPASPSSPAPAPAPSPTPAGPHASSVSELFEIPNQAPINDDKSKLSMPDILKLIDGQSRGTAAGGTMDQSYRTSSVDYGSRDYYNPPMDTSSNFNIRKDVELDELHKTGSDTRGNWWQGSFHY